MFESEDMLPRTAPKPSCAPAIEMAKTSVPEVSILFGQQQQTASADNKQNEQVTHNKYAQWKLEKLLPTKTNCNAISNSKMRAATLPPSNGLMQQQHQRHSLDGLAVAVALDKQHFQTQAHRTAEQQVNVPQSRRVSWNPEPLTICATTQTDTSMNDQHEQCVSKQDFQQLFELIVKMREDQLHLGQLCETIYMQQQQWSAPPAAEKLRQTCDAQTQYETTATIVTSNDRRPPQIMRNYMAEVEKLERRKAELYQNLPQQRFNTPLAKSTVYQHANNVVSPKRQVDKSLFMNNLASKYLPTERFNEMLQDMHLPTTAVNAAVTSQSNGSTRSLSDLSSASYKYLKKYRLLPEEQQMQQQQQQQITEPTSEEDEAVIKCNKMPQRMRCDSPLHEQHNNYYRSASPMASIIDDEDNDNIAGDQVANASAAVEQINLLNLEHIRRQPKYL